MILIILLVLGILVFFIIFKKIKRLKLDCITLVVGAPKTGKTTIQVYLAIKDNKKRIRKTKFKNFFKGLLKKEKDELPLLYSNIPLKYPHVRLTKELLLREQRFVYNSTILISETSLVADSMSFKNEQASDTLSAFYKLIGHELHGGAVFVETQNPADNHYSLKRCLNRYLFIYHMTKWIPFFLIVKVREFAYLDGVEGVNNNFNEDIEDSMKVLFIRKSIWKKFDAYTYSILTDNLEVDRKVIQPKEVDTLKTKEILSIKEILKDKKKGDQKHGQ